MKSFLCLQGKIVRTMILKKYIRNAFSDVNMRGGLKVHANHRRTIYLATFQHLINFKICVSFLFIYMTKIEQSLSKSPIF